MSLVYFSNYKIGVIFSFKKFGTVFFSTILHAISVWCGLLKIWCSFFLYSFIGKFYWKWLYIQKLQAHSQNYVNRKLSNLQKAPGRQLVSVLFSTKEGGKRNEMKWNGKHGNKKQSNLTLYELINVEKMRFQLASQNKKMRFQMVPKETLMLPASPSSVFHTKFTTSDLESK